MRGEGDGGMVGMFIVLQYICNQVRLGHNDPYERRTNNFLTVT